MCSAVRSSLMPFANSRTLSLKPRSTRTGPIGDLYRTPKPAPARRRPNSKSPGFANTLPAIEERGGAKIAPDGHSELRVEDQQRVAPLREPVLIDRVVVAEPIEREPAHGRVPSREEALAGRHFFDNGGERLTVGTQDRSVVPSSCATSRANAAASPRRAPHRHDGPPAAGQPGGYGTPGGTIARSRLPSRGAARPDRLRAPTSWPARGVERIVACIARVRGLDGRQPNLREQPIDQQLVFLGESLIEQLRAVERVAAGHAARARQAARQGAWSRAG